MTLRLEKRKVIAAFGSSDPIEGHCAQSKAPPLRTIGVFRLILCAAEQKRGKEARDFELLGVGSGARASSGAKRASHYYIANKQNTVLAAAHIDNPLCHPRITLPPRVEESALRCWLVIAILRLARSQPH